MMTSVLSVAAAAPLQDCLHSPDGSLQDAHADTRADDSLPARLQVDRQQGLAGHVLRPRAPEAHIGRHG